MTNEEILREINSLPPKAQRQLEDFIASLRERYKGTQAATAPVSDLESKPFVGVQLSPCLAFLSRAGSIMPERLNLVSRASV